MTGGKKMRMKAKKRGCEKGKDDEQQKKSEGKQSRNERNGHKERNKEINKGR